MTNDKLKWIKPILIIFIIVNSLTIITRQMGGLESWELTVFDRMIRWRPSAEKDNRLFVVKITAEDVQIQKQWPLSDAILSELLTKLNQHQPIAIGLDIYRDLPVNPGHEEFIKQINEHDNIIPVCKANDSESRGVSPPPNISDERTGFADIVVDLGGTVRRSLIFMQSGDNSLCKTPYSFSFQLARRYLATINIEPELTEKQELKLGSAVFPKLNSSSGSYQQLDTGGYQILLNYRSGGYISDTVTLDDVLNNRVKPSQIKNKLVLIGVTDPAIDDAFYTPYSAGAKTNQKMPGVNVHAQITSQLISVALGERKLFWFWSDAMEIIWISGWCLVGTIIPYSIRRPWYLILAESTGFIIVLSSSWFIFLQAGWIPIIPPLLALIFSSSLMIAYIGYEEQEKGQKISFLVEQQNQALLELQQLLQQDNINKIELQHKTEITSFSTTEVPPEIEQKTKIVIEEYQDEKYQEKVLLNGRYKISTILGQGGFGCIYLAQDTEASDSQCIIKRLQPARQDDNFLGVARRLFKTEVQILQQLGSHPQIPQLWGYFEEQDEFYLVEEYIPGMLLTEELNRNNNLTEKKVIDILQEILTILQYIHLHGVIHRDLKPSNIIRSSINNKLVLIDFGAVKQINPDLDNTYQVERTVAIGTKGYAAPEQFLGQPTFSSDIYSLGMIAIQALTGIHPEKLKINNKTGNVSWQHLRTIDKSFALIIDKMVAYHFPQRYQSAIAVLEALEKI